MSLIIIVSIILSATGYSAPDSRCKMSIKEVHSNNKEFFSTLEMKKWFPNTDRLIFRRDEAKKNDRLDVSYDIDGTIDILPETESDKEAAKEFPQIKVTAIDKEYSLSADLLKKEKELALATRNKKQLTITLEKNMQCSKADASVMLFFVERWFFRN